MKKVVGIFSSPKTSASAILGFLVLLFTQIGYNFDADPATSIDFGVIFSGLLMAFGLLKARDNDKSSEDVGLVEPPAAPVKPAPPSNAKPYGGS